MRSAWNLSARKHPEKKVQDCEIIEIRKKRKIPENKILWHFYRTFELYVQDLWKGMLGVSTFSVHALFIVQIMRARTNYPFEAP
jgi:hypothetical protein